MTKAEQIETKLQSFNRHQRFGHALKFIEKMIPIWDQFAAESYSLYYVDSVVGMHHGVKADLVNRTFELGMRSLMEDLPIPELIALIDEYGDPIVAIQDQDWNLPYDIEWLFHASYNLMRYLTNSGPESQEEIAYMIVNQAINAVVNAGILKQNEILALLNE